MRNVHDVGGQLGWGAVPRGDGHAFHDEWERISFGLTLAVIPNGFLNNVDENRYAKERMRPQDLMACSYFELWLAALEMNLVENGILGFDEIRAAEQAALEGKLTTAPATERPELTEAIDGMLAHGGDLASTKDAPRMFAVGDAVRVAQPNTRRHSRVPTYVLGRSGLVTTTLAAYPIPQVVAHGLGSDTDWCYTVRFEVTELWGLEASRDAVYVDMWQSNLRHATPTDSQDKS